jgi:hypothetical protein
MTIAGGAADQDEVERSVAGFADRRPHLAEPGAPPIEPEHEGGHEHADNRPHHRLLGLHVEIEQRNQQHREGEREIPAGAQHLSGLRDLVGIDRWRSLLRRVEVGLNEQREVVKNTGHQRRDHYVGVGNFQELGHQEGRRAHEGGINWPPVEATASMAPAL